MKVNQIILRNFRNYTHLKLDFTQNINVFIGENAQGKTNVLESLYYGAMGRSHRTNTDSELIRWQQKAGSIEIAFSRMNVDNRLHFTMYQQEPREIQHNGYKIKPKEVVGLFNVVLFSPEDLLLVKGMPSLRRRFLDMELSQASPNYYQQLTKYNRILSQRNMLLKKIRERKASLEMLLPWDVQLAEMAGKIVGKRLEAVKKLSMLANLMHRKITANRENLSIVYEVQGFTDKEDSISSEQYMKKIEEMRQQDIFRGSTSIGPHRDDLILWVNGMNLRTFGSQGQQRTGVLSLKLAELEFIKSETSEYPILLLDDVMSELDASRREHLLAFIKDRIQTFITATEEKYFPEERFGKFYRVENGMVTE